MAMLTCVFGNAFLAIGHANFGARVDTIRIVRTQYADRANIEFYMNGREKTSVACPEQNFPNPVQSSVC